MNIVIVKSENSGQQYLVEIPGGRGNCIKAGVLVRVKTNAGDFLATCLCDSFFIEEDGNVFQAICSSFGATQPLAQVIGVYIYSKFPRA